MNRTSLTVRAAALVTAIVFSGAAFGAQKLGSDQTKSDCLNQALIQFNVDDALCFNYPAGTAPFNICRSQAQMKYANAVAACTTAANGTGLFGHRFSASDGRQTTTVAPNVRAW